MNIGASREIRGNHLKQEEQQAPTKVQRSSRNLKVELKGAKLIFQFRGARRCVPRYKGCKIVGRQKKGVSSSKWDICAHHYFTLGLSYPHCPLIAINSGGPQKDEVQFQKLKLDFCGPYIYCILYKLANFMVYLTNPRQECYNHIIQRLQWTEDLKYKQQ